jgi:D-methionine transport system ATP-binding protein
MMGSLLSLQNVGMTYPSRGGKPPFQALKDFNLEISEDKPSIIAIAGESGSGKTTLGRLVLGMIGASEGRMAYRGQTPEEMSRDQRRDFRREVQAIFQDPFSVFNPFYKVDHLLHMPLKTFGIARGRGEADALIAEALSRVGLRPEQVLGRYPHQLSGGQRQRIAVARALAANPSVLLADEPTSALDPETTGSVLTVLDRARAELGVTVLVVTHDMGVVRKICDDVAVLEQGRVVEHGKVLDLVNDAASRTSSALLPAVDLNPINESNYDRVADVVLVGFAAVGALLPEAAHRFGVELNIVGGGLTRLGETPVARFRLGLNGERSDSALEWIGEAGGAVQRSLKGPQGVAA